MMCDGRNIGKVEHSGIFSFSQNHTKTFSRSLISRIAQERGNSRKPRFVALVGFVKSTAMLTLYHTIPNFNDPTEKSVKNILGKGENAG